MTHTCPLQGVVLKRRCPVTTCMWNCQRKESGCLHGSLLVDNDSFLATMKDCDDVESEVEDATRRIKCMLILDGYCSFLRGKEEPVPAKMTRTLIRLMERPQFSRRNGWSLQLLHAALSKRVWFTFKRTLGDEPEFIHREVLGLTLKTYKKLQLQLSN